MAFRVQGTSPEDIALVEAVRAGARAQGITFSEAVRRAFTTSGRTVVPIDPDPTDPPASPQPKVRINPAPHEHKWVRGGSGITHCSGCGAAKT